MRQEKKKNLHIEKEGPDKKDYSKGDTKQLSPILKKIKNGWNLNEGTGWKMG